MEPIWGEEIEGAEGVEANPRRLVPRAQTWQGTTETTTSRVTYLRAQTWQHTVNLQTVPEGMRGERGTRQELHLINLLLI